MNTDRIEELEKLLRECFEHVHQSFVGVAHDLHSGTLQQDTLSSFKFHVSLLKEHLDMAESEIEEAHAEQIVPDETTRAIVRQAIYDAQANASERHLALLEENHREEFIDSITQAATVEPLIAQIKVSRQQIVTWVHEILHE